MGTSRKVLAIVSTLRYIDCMFKLPEFPAVDFSKFDLDALRKLDLSKYVPDVRFPTVDLPNIDFATFNLPGNLAGNLPSIDVSKLTDAVRDAAYLTVAVGIAAADQVREIADAARSRVVGLIRNAA